MTHCQFYEDFIIWNTNKIQSDTNQSARLLIKLFVFSVNKGKSKYLKIINSYMDCWFNDLAVEHSQTFLLRSSVESCMIMNEKFQIFNVCLTIYVNLMISKKSPKH